MEKRIRRDTKILWILKGLLTAYVVTGILLLLLAMALYRLELNEKKRICGCNRDLCAVYAGRRDRDRKNWQKSAASCGGFCWEEDIFCFLY